MRQFRGLFVLMTLLAPACAPDHLPEQDLRILTAAPAAKLSVDDLWKDFQKDPKAARRQYFGVAVDVSGKVVSIDVANGKTPTILFGPADQRGVRARILDERAAEIIKTTVVYARTTLRCFCEGLNDQQDLVLKSCIRP